MVKEHAWQILAALIVIASVLTIMYISGNISSCGSYQNITAGVLPNGTTWLIYNHITYHKYIIFTSGTFPNGTQWFEIRKPYSFTCGGFP